MRYENRFSKHSDICAFSFHPVKILAGGEGGVVTTNDEKIYKNILAFRSHGIIGGNAKYKNQSVAYTNSKEIFGITKCLN